MMLASRCFVIIILLTLLGCSGKPIERSIVIGKYLANHKLGIDQLELKEDGTYTYYFKFPNGKEFTNSNRWELEYLDKVPVITFEEFIFALPGFESRKSPSLKTPGFWPAEIQVFGKRTRLCIDEDLGYYYNKRDVQVFLK